MKKNRESKVGREKFEKSKKKEESVVESWKLEVVFKSLFTLLLRVSLNTIKMNDISFIVDTLNLPPFEKKLTIVEFANKNPIELLQIVNDVFALIDETQRLKQKPSFHACFYYLSP